DTQESAIGLIKSKEVIFAVVANGSSYILVEGGEVIPQTPEENTEEAYINLALDGSCGSAWSIQSALDKVVSFTKAFVIESVVKVSQELGVIEACVFC
ncbi:hypothetical protein, partial [Salmonella sp. s51228]|uniref:hypothetical protein n=1 Tax=Salmonella sp. s51228 TaxID=3159652 RepID=UPI003980257C